MRQSSHSAESHYRSIRLLGDHLPHLILCTSSIMELVCSRLTLNQTHTSLQGFQTSRNHNIMDATDHLDWFLFELRFVFTWGDWCIKLMYTCNSKSVITTDENQLISPTIVWLQSITINDFYRLYPVRSKPDPVVAVASVGVIQIMRLQKLLKVQWFYVRTWRRVLVPPAPRKQFPSFQIIIIKRRDRLLQNLKFDNSVTGWMVKRLHVQMIL